MKSRIFVLLFVCSLFQMITVAQDRQNNNTLLWEISGNGAKKPSFLYGTMHVSNKLVYNFQDTFYVALKSADIVALEINLDSFLVDMSRSGYLEDFAEYSRGSCYKDFYSKITDIEVPDIDLFTEEFALNDDLTNHLLYRTRSYEADYEESTYLDLFIFQAAKKLKKGVTGLENFAKSEEYSYLSRLPDKKENRDDYDYNSSYGYRKYYALLEEAYRQGNLEMIDSITRMTSRSKNYYHYFIVKRNEMMANTIDSLMKSQGVFAACGVAHLPGDSGIISLLRAKGYTLRPVKTPVTPASHKEREKIENLLFVQRMSSFTAPDSTFTVMVPGPMHKIPTENIAERYIFPDMANGAVFQVSYIRTFGMLYGKDKQSYIQKLDSVFYEIIPGKILKKTKTDDRDGYTVYDITSKTNGGKLLKYSIFTGNLDTYIFKLAGSKEFVSSAIGNAFLNSIRIRKPGDEKWKKYEFANAGIRFEMPGGAVIDNNINKDYYCNTNGNTDLRVQAFDENSNQYYLLISASLFDFDYIEEDKFELTRLTQMLFKDHAYRNIWAKDVAISPYIFHDACYRDSVGQYAFVRTSLHGPHYYILATRQADSVFPARFFNSFMQIQCTSAVPLAAYTDPDLYFNVQTTPYLGESKASISYRYSKILENARNYDDDEDYYYSYRENEDEMEICSGVSPECVQVTLTLVNPYKKFKKGFWESRKRSLLYRNTMVVESEKYYRNDEGLSCADFLLADTNSVRNIHVHMILKQGALYTLKAIIQAGEEPGGWTGNFFKTFSPSDTLMGCAPDSNGSQRFIDQLTGNDSVQKKKAIRSAFLVTLDSACISKLIAFINSDEFKKLKGKTRCTLIEMIEDDKTGQSHPLLRQLYNIAGDSAQIQLAVLNALAEQKTDAAAKVFAELLIQDPPLEIANRNIDNIFEPFDSTACGAILFPGLFELTRYQEYRDPVYALLANLIENKFITTDKYHDFVKQILSDANEKLKREISSVADFADDNDQRYDWYYSSYYRVPSKSEIDNFNIILFPYFSDEKVKQYFAKIFRSKVDEHIYSTALFMLKNKQPLEDSLFRYFSKSECWRNQLYDDLKKADCTDKFDNAYLTQAGFSKSLLFGKKHKKNTDTVSFVCRRYVITKSDSGYVYFFIKKSRNGLCGDLFYAGLQPTDTSKVIAFPDICDKRGASFGKDKSMQQLIAESIEKIELTGRRRISSNNSFWDDEDY